MVNLNGDISPNLLFWDSEHEKQLNIQNHETYNLSKEIQITPTSIQALKAQINPTQKERDLFNQFKRRN